MAAPCPSVGTRAPADGQRAESPPRRKKDTARAAGYIEWRPHRKSQILLGQVEQILDEYRAHLPLTVRQIYYRMVAAYGHPKGKVFNETLSDILIKGRRSGRIPFESIRDDGIQGHDYAIADLETFLALERDRRGWFAPSLQVDQEKRLEVWCEAAGMLPQLARVADDYSVPVYSCGGFNSLTAIRQIVDDVVQSERDTVLLHLGDYDPSGESMYKRVETDVSAFLQEDAAADDEYGPLYDFELERVALTKAQISIFNLSMDELETEDSRSKKWKSEGRTLKCELEALAPNVIAELLREAIESHVDPDVLAETRERGELERAALLNFRHSGETAEELRDAAEREPLRLLYPPPLGNS